VPWHVLSEHQKSRQLSKMQDFDDWRFPFVLGCGKTSNFCALTAETACCARHFGLLHNSRAAVSIYADAWELLALALADSLNSVSLP